MSDALAIDPLLIPDFAAARLAGVCRATWHRLRAAGKLPVDAPLVEAPAFTGPPRDRRGLPMHYFPRRKTLIERAGALVHTTFSLAGLRTAGGHGCPA